MDYVSATSGGIGFSGTYDIDPALAQAIGEVIVWWARLDTIITSTCMSFWTIAHQRGGKMPQSFRTRATHLKNFAKALYANEPEEYRAMAWFIQRVRTINDKRDDIAHGNPGIITRNGRSYPGYPWTIRLSVSHSTFLCPWRTSRT